MALDIVSLAYPFVMGVFVMLSPCGYALIPGYISYYLGSELTVSRALKGGVVSTIGLITVYAAIGLGSTVIGGLIKPYITLLTVFAGVMLIILGALILANVQLPFAYQVISSERKGLRGFYVYGIAYGLAAAGCTAPLFFSVVLIAFTRSGPFDGLVTLLVYDSYKYTCSDGQATPSSKNTELDSKAT
jgi:cytochrome c-type biogenesis protein